MKAYSLAIPRILAVWALLFTGASMAQAADPAAAALLYEGQDREQRLAEGARKEGEVHVYTSLVVGDITALSEAFEKKYGVKVKFWRAGSEKVVQRITTEARAGRHEVDVVETNGPELESLQREKLLQKGYSPHFADLLPDAIRPHREWVGTRLNMFVHIYNTKLIKKDDIPKSWEELADPKWKGKLGIEAEDYDWFSVVAAELGEQKAVTLFRQIVATNGMSVRKGHTLLAGLTASGEVPFALTVYSHNAEKLKTKGAPVDWYAIPPAVVRPNGVGVSRKAPHPNAAALFYDFILSPEGQAILVKGEYLPTSRKLGADLEKMKAKFVDPAKLLDENEKWMKIYDDIFTKPAR